MEDEETNDNGYSTIATIVIVIGVIVAGGIVGTFVLLSSFFE